MTKKIIIFLTISMLTLCGQTWAESEKQFTKEDVKQFRTNSSFFFADKDTIGSLYALSALRNGEGNLALEMLEHQLDVIVCSIWEMKDKLNEPSRVRAMELLRKIKAYRSSNPRKIEGYIDPEEVKEIFPGVDSWGIDVTKQARQILSGLK